MMIWKTKIWGKIVSGVMLLLFWFLPPCIFAQNPNIRFKRISIDEGLSQSTVYCILQDKKGFMWFGTQEGVESI